MLGVILRKSDGKCYLNNRRHSNIANSFQLYCSHKFSSKVWHDMTRAAHMHRHGQIFARTRQFALMLAYMIINKYHHDKLACVHKEYPC